MPAEVLRLIAVPPGCKHRSPDDIVVKLALKGTPLKSVGPNLRANVRFCRSIEGNLPVATCTVSKVAAVFFPVPERANRTGPASHQQKLLNNCFRLANLLPKLPAHSCFSILREHRWLGSHTRFLYLLAPSHRICPTLGGIGLLRPRCLSASVRIGCYSTRSTLNFAGDSCRTNSNPFASLPMPITVFGSIANCFSSVVFVFQ
jgi:hypothetical protein